MNKLFAEYYYKDDNVYPINQLWQMIKADDKFDKKTKKIEFINWLNNQEDHQTEKVNYKPPNHLMHPIIGKPNSYQSDLMFLKELHNLNNGYDSIINFVEITTKKAYSYPLKSKNQKEVLDAFKKFYDDIDENITILDIDKGSEYNDIIKFCKSNDITTVIYNGDKNSMSIAERYNRTLRTFISKKCKDGVWIHKLNILVNAYNNRIHSSTGYTPNYLFDHPELQEEIRRDLIGEAIPARLEMEKFNIGDKVRFYKKKNQFGKGGGSYSQTVHTITDIKKNSIFLDNNDDKKYRYYNLLKIDKVEQNENKPDTTKLDENKKMYKTALKLAKEQTNRMSVKDTEKHLMNVLNDTSKRNRSTSKYNDILERVKGKKFN